MGCIFLSKSKRYNPGILYFSDRISDSMKRIVDYPLTIVEAAMGYGKTTAVKEHINNETVKVLWQTVYDGFASNFWSGFTRLFDEIDQTLALSMAQLGVPNDSVSMREALLLIEGIQLTDNTVIVIDDYHLIDQVDIHNFIEVLVRKEIPNLHIVLVTRLILLDNLDELKLKGYVHHICQEVFELTPSEISRYYRCCGINLEAEGLNSLYAYTQGWISALYLCMLNYIAENRFEQKPSEMRGSTVPNIYNLFEKAVYLPLSDETKEFLLGLCIFDRFTAEQAVHMWSKPNAAELLKELITRNVFLRYDPKSKSYQMHNILSNFMQDKLEDRESGHRQALYRKAAQWYIKTGDSLAGMHYSYLGQDFDTLLSAFEYARSKSINREHKELLIKYMEDCPDSIKAKHHLAMLIYAIRLFTFNERELFAKTCAMFLKNVHADRQLDEKSKNQLLGECELILSFTKYNDIKGMSEYHKKACQLMTAQTAVIDQNGIWTFGSPSILYLFYRAPGELSQQVSDMIESMPYYYDVTGGHGSGAEYIMQAEAYYYQGDFENAEITVNKALYTAQARQQSAISVCARFLQMRLALLKGNYPEAQELLQNLRTESMQRQEYIFMHTLDICEAYIYAFLRQGDKIPAWIATGDFNSSRLFFQVQAFSNLIYGRVLLIKGNYFKLLGIAEHFIAIASIFPNLLANIYTYIYLAAANEAIFRHEEALAVLQQALDLAMPDHMYMPFVENCDYIRTLLEQLERNSPYGQDIRRILELNKHYESSAALIIQTHFTENKSHLSAREIEIARMAAAGLTNKEIAASLFISTNTVKTQLKSIFEKLGINSRALLKQYLG